MDCTPASDQHSMIETLQEFDQGFSVLLVSLALQEETFLVVPKLTLGLDHKEMIHLSENLILVKGISI